MKLEDAPPPADRSAGFKPDPLGSGNQRKWDGSGWTGEVKLAEGKKMGSGMKWLIGIGCGLVVIFAIGALGGGDDDSDSTSSNEPAAPVEEQQTTGFEKTLQDAVLESVDEKEFPTFWCRGEECRVYYRRGATAGILLSGQEEILEEQRRIWKTMFSRPQTKVARIRVDGPVTTVGGKTKVAPILDVTCTRAAADLINWNRVDVDGMSALCDWNELVDF